MNRTPLAEGNSPHQPFERLYCLLMSLPIPDAAVCIQCSYLLRGLENPRCPECGQSFDPDDPPTYVVYTMPSWVRWAQPPSLLECVLAVIAGLWILEDFSNQIASHPYVVCLAPILMVGLVLYYLVRILACLSLKNLQGDAAGLRAGQHCEPSSAPSGTQASRGSSRWAVLPVVVMILASAMLTNWPMRVRFHFSLPAFERVVRNIETDPSTNTGPQWIGLYYIKRIGYREHGSIGFVTGTSLWDPVGYLYDPNPRATGRLTQQLAPRWYAKEW
ncbi:MAG: hypothetical protein JSU63_15685 [Phycisphaerales bacterium]|nr:MAG: hypothetical protein JSU63_15685 [Phycisphaerales bacterium]